MSEAEYRPYNPIVNCPLCGAEMQHITLELEYRSDKPVYHFYDVEGLLAAVQARSG